MNLGKVVDWDGWLYLMQGALCLAFLYGGFHYQSGAEVVEDRSCSYYWTEFKGEDISGFKLLNESEYQEWRRNISEDPDEAVYGPKDVKGLNSSLNITGK